MELDVEKQRHQESIAKYQKDQDELLHMKVLANKNICPEIKIHRKGWRGGNHLISSLKVIGYNGVVRHRQSSLRACQVLML